MNRRDPYWISNDAASTLGNAQVCHTVSNCRFLKLATALHRWEEDKITEFLYQKHE